jgi:serine/threonine-protein kinase
MNDDNAEMDTIEQARLVDRICTEFEEAWRGGRRPRLEDYLPTGTPEATSALLRELIGVDVEYRRHAGEEPRGEDYLTRFPGLDRGWLEGMLRPPDTLSPASALPTPAPAEDCRFPPGLLLAGRYRIVALLGKGGMGEVYRADDLKLGQPVALKFLPAEVARHPQWLERIRHEVRVARQITHPNVCRVHDLGEWRGQAFLTMELIDGENLATLLRRIGRLPEDKAVEVARQLCLGLAASHEKGVLHRDLKPHNVMLDGQGQVRITDFGLAAHGRDLRGASVQEGTPAYQAPEQLSGREVTFRSDLYALGLILYEVFTGRKPFEARTREELLAQLEHKTPVSPSFHVGGIDPRVERIVLRCLARDPSERPGSALEVAAALPGGDTLAAALAAGKLPSTETVCPACSEEGTLRPAVAASLLGAILLGMVVVGLLADRARLFRMVPLGEKPPAVLKDRARQVLNRIGHRAPAVDHGFQYMTDLAYLNYLATHDSSPRRWEPLGSAHPAAMYAWYVQAPHRLVRRGFPYPQFPGRAGPADTPVLEPGMASVSLNLLGRLIELRIAPEPESARPDANSACDWKPLFDAAGLDYENDFCGREHPSNAVWDPYLPHDGRAAWRGSFPDFPDVPLRIEAASYRGKPVYFQLIGPWQEAPERPSWFGGRPPLANVYASAFLMAALVTGAPLAWRNWRLGRGDRRAAFRLALLLFALRVVMWAVVAEHVLAFLNESAMIATGIGFALYFAFPVWVAYLALEPYVRRHWPWRIVSWTRVLDGRFGGPLVGRDVLIGGAAGVLLALLQALPHVIAPWLGLAPPLPQGGAYSSLTNVPFSLLGSVTQGVLVSLTFFSLFFVLDLLLRRESLAAGALFVLLLILFSPRWWAPESVWLSLGFSALGTALIIAVVLRFGLLALTFAFIFFNMLHHRVVALDLSAWYSTSCLAYLLVLSAVAVFGFAVALGGRPLFRAGFFREG